MSGYSFECPSCENVHAIERPDRYDAAHTAHERQCDDCGQDGCVDCIPNALCSTCRAECCNNAETCTDPLKCQECPRGGYTQQEMDCRACTGPCGRCHED